MWLDAYQPIIDAYKVEISARDALQEFEQIEKKKTEKEIKSLKPGVWRQPAEKTWAALLFCRIRDGVKDLRYSDEEAHNRAVAVVRELFHDRGYSDEQTDERVIAVLEAAKKL